MIEFTYGMTLRDGFWYPNNFRQVVGLLAVIVLVLLHESSLVGLMNAGVVLGWLPTQLAYDIVYVAASTGLLYWMYTTLAPEQPELRQTPTGSETSGGAESTEGTPAADTKES